MQKEYRIGYKVGTERIMRKRKKRRIKKDDTELKREEEKQP